MLVSAVKNNDHLWTNAHHPNHICFVSFMSVPETAVAGFAGTRPCHHQARAGQIRTHPGVKMGPKFGFKVAGSKPEKRVTKFKQIGHPKLGKKGVRN